MAEERPAVDVNTPSIARMYDYWLGGKDNFAADRAAAERLMELLPEARDIALANRRFLIRVIRHLSARGIDQFIDLGTGVPTAPNVHDIARETHPGARVVYVDNDPIVAVHNDALRVTDGVLALTADARDTAAVLDAPKVRELIDFDRPVAVLCIAVIHYLGGDDEVRPMIERYRDAVAPGSYLAASIASTEGSAGEESGSQELVREGASVLATTSSPPISRSRENIAALLSCVDLDEPGLVPVEQWRAEEPRLPMSVLAGVGRFRK